MSYWKFAADAREQRRLRQDGVSEWAGGGERKARATQPIRIISTAVRTSFVASTSGSISFTVSSAVPAAGTAMATSTAVRGSSAMSAAASTSDPGGFTTTSTSFAPSPAARLDGGSTAAVESIVVSAAVSEPFAASLLIPCQPRASGRTAGGVLEREPAHGLLLQIRVSVCVCRDWRHPCADKTVCKSALLNPKS